VHFNHQHARSLTPADKPALQAERDFVHLQCDGSSDERRTQKSPSTQTVLSQKHLAIRGNEIPVLGWQ